MPDTGLSLIPPTLNANESVVQSSLIAINKDPSFDVVENVIAQYAVAQNISSWAIGDVLVFIAKRSGYISVMELQTDSIPEEVNEYIREMGYRFDDGISGQFLYWKTLEFPRCMILQDQNSVIVWEKSGNGMSQPELEKYFKSLESRLATALSGSGLYAKYTTSLHFPIDKRRPDMSWTWHNEVVNIVGRQANGAGPGERQLLADRFAEDLEDRSITTVKSIRDEKKQLERDRRGYKWIAPITYIEIDDGDGPFRFIELYNNCPKEVAQIILWGAGLGIYPHIIRRPELKIMGDYSITCDGESVGRVNPEHAFSEAALIEISGKIGWIIAG